MWPVVVMSVDRVGDGAAALILLAMLVVVGVCALVVMKTVRDEVEDKQRQQSLPTGTAHPVSVAGSAAPGPVSEVRTPLSSPFPRLGGVAFGEGPAGVLRAPAGPCGGDRS